jgi:predicted negative regulator of RcsB-dependent stress response
MKAERRHELKTNTLAQGLGGLPMFWAQHGTKVLLAVVAVLAIVLFFRFQASSAKQRESNAAEAYASAVSAIDNLRGLQNIRDPRLASEQRRQIQEQADAGLRQVLDDTKDDTLRANALLAQGDLWWTLAHTHDPGSAQTQPTSRPRASSEDQLERAKRAYETAAIAPGAKPITINSALLGLAAVAEEQGKWDEAAAQYDKIRTHPSLPPAFKLEAQDRKASLDKIRTPALIGKPPTRPAFPQDELPSTGPMGPPVPTTGATTRPAGAAAPTTQSRPTTSGAIPVER